MREAHDFSRGRSHEVRLQERAAVEERVDFDFGAAYDRPFSERLRAYLEVPYDSIADVVPKWKLTADVRPEAEHVGALPFLAHELAVVRCPGRAGGGVADLDDLSERAESFFHNDPQAVRRSTRAGATRSSASTTEPAIFRPPPSDSIEQAYVGDGLPVGASKMTTDSYDRRLEFEPSTDPKIDVTVVCNDEEMTDENVVSDIYGTRDWVEFDISFRELLTTAEMRDVLESDVDFLHYVGHVDAEGVRCTDGYLDTQDLSEVSVGAFLLNACDSYEQGCGLVDAGAMAGIATMTDVVNEAATSVGRTAAKLLNQGFSLAATVSIINEYEQIGHHYLVVGDASASIVENQSGTPNLVSIENRGEDEYRTEIFGYPTLSSRMGAMFTPQIEGVDRFYLNAGRMGRHTLQKETLLEFVHTQEFPVEFDGALRWSSDLLELWNQGPV
ncbi:MAG: hypothetical protein ABEJ26_07130 [Halosimplex sp.]